MSDTFQPLPPGCFWEVLEGDGMNATDTGAALLSAILAEPADDLHRLAYADWLEETGDPERAEFIRLQLGLAGDVRRAGWREVLRAEKLLHDRRDWLDPLGYVWIDHNEAEADTVRVGGWRGVTLTLRRGFVEAVACPLAVWLEYGPALVRRHPVERVVVTGANPVDHLRPGEWWWWTNGPAEIHIGCDIPPYLWACLRKSPPARHYWGRRYNSEREAMDDLSAACLEWAKGKGATG